MEKTIKLGKRSLKLTSRVKWMVIYKNQFGRDIFPTLVPVANTVVELVVALAKMTGGKPLTKDGVYEMIQKIDVEDIQSAIFSLAGLEVTDAFAITWCMAKAANEDIEAYDEFVDGLDAFPVDEIVPAIISMNVQALTSTKNFKRLQAAVEALKPNLLTSTES